MLVRGALFSGRHKPIPAGLTAAVQAADTREMNDPSQMDFDMLSIFFGGDVIRDIIKTGR